MLEDSKAFNLLLKLFPRDISIFVVIKLFEEHSHLRVVLFGFYPLKTV